MSETKQQKPNLRFSPEALNDGYHPVPSYKDGLDEIVMPSIADQIKGFYHKEASKIIRLSGGLIKSFDPETQVDVDLPSNFPSREVFRKAGLNLADVKKLIETEKLGEVDGVGEKTFEKVVEYLTNLEAE